jgi:carboxylesterase
MNSHEKIQSREGHMLLVGGRVGVLLIHGLGGTPVELRFVAQGLHRAGYTVYSPLLDGHGGSKELLNTTTWQDWYRSVEEAHDLLRQRCEIILVGGLSAGAMLALHLAANRPQQVHGTLLFSPTMWPNGWAIPWYFALFKLIHQKWFANLFRLKECAPYGIKDDRIRKFVLESLQSDGRPLDDIFGRKGGTVLEFKWLVNTVKHELASVKQPTLIFHSRFDDQADIGNTIALLHRLGGLVDIVVLDDSYHMVTLDRQRTLVAERTVAFAGWLAQWQNESSEVARLVEGAAVD